MTRDYLMPRAQYRRRSRSRTPPRRRRSRTPPPRRRSPISRISNTIVLSNVAPEISPEDVFDLLMPRAIRIQGFVKLKNSSYQIKFFDTSSLEDCLRLDGEYFKGRRVKIDIVSEWLTDHYPHPFRPPLSKRPAQCSTLFLGNIPDAVSEDDLKKFFAKISYSDNVGPQSISLKRGIKGLNYAHVRFENELACYEATSLAGSILRGSRVRMDWASSAPAKQQPDAATVQRDEPISTNRLFVGGLSDSLVESDLQAVLGHFGKISNIKIHKDRNQVRSFGYVTFFSNDSVDNVVKTGNHIFVKGTQVRVDYARQERINAITSVIGARRPTRPASPPRVTPVSFDVPLEYNEPPWEAFYPT
jgi:RNA recognition motif. (a.k.a. RRM, RBD, or RNP domain)